MTDRSIARYPGRRWRLFLVCAVGVFTGAVLVAGLFKGGVTGDGFVFALGSLAFFAVSSVMVIRVPENRLSWLLMTLSLAINLMAVFDGSPVDSVGDVLGGLALFGVVLPGLGVFIPLWFPTGSPPTPRWRWVSRAAVLGVVGVILGFVLVIYVEGGDNDIESCVSIGSCSSIIGVTLILGAIVAGVSALIVRWVRSSGVERLQMKWLVLAFLAFAIGALAEFGGFQYSVVANVFLPAGVVLVPLTIGIAVLRYRLYEIDRIISRAVSYTLVVGLLAVVFFGSVTLLSSMLSSESDLVTAAATLFVAALFNPVRRQVQRWVDRRFNRSRYDTEQVMDRFSGSLRDEIDPDQVVEGWVSVVSSTMQPESVGVWVRADSRNDFGTVGT